MATSSQTSSTPRATLDEKPLEAWRQLGLRPTTFASKEHPDVRPCPSWCWIEDNNPDGYKHEVDPRHITSAIHTTEEPIKVRASFYEADNDLEAETTTAATLEAHLQQTGASLPRVRVSLRSYGRKKRSDGKGYYAAQQYDSDRLVLNIEDARELAAVLTYLADLAGVTEVQS